MEKSVRLDTLEYGSVSFSGRFDATGQVEVVVFRTSGTERWIRGSEADSFLRALGEALGEKSGTLVVDGRMSRSHFRFTPISGENRIRFFVKGDRFHLGPVQVRSLWEALMDMRPVETVRLTMEG